MDINLTFIVQGFAFFAVAWLVMKFGWPNIIAAAKARKVPLALVNARLSARSQRGYQRLSALSRPLAERPERSGRRCEQARET